MKVLLVEAEPEGLSGIEETISRLSDSGIELERAWELASALERLSQGGIDLILLDLTLPDSQGIVRPHGLSWKALHPDWRDSESDK